MPPSYGVAGRDHDDSVPALSSQTEPLLGGDERDYDGPVRNSQLRDGKASLLSGISNLANTIMGTGMLTFPLAMASAGLLPGVITCIFSGCMSAFGLYLLSRCATHTAHRQASFFAISQLTFPRAAVFFDLAIAIKCFGVSISYLIIIKSLMPSVVTAIANVLGSQPPAWALSGRIWISLFMLVLVPLCFLRHLDSLRHTSYVALVSVAYLVTIVVVCYFHPPAGSQEPGDIYLIHFTPGFISTFPVQVFAFTCAQNIFPIYNEVKSNTQTRMNITIGSSIGSAILTYEVIAVFGYLTFGSKVGANIIAMYPPTTLFIAFGQLAIVILVLFSYPLQVHPCRACLDKVFHWDTLKTGSHTANVHAHHQPGRPIVTSGGQVVPTSPITGDTPSYLALPQNLENGGTISPIPTPLAQPDVDEDGETIPSTRRGAGAIYLPDEDEEVTAAEDPDHASDEMTLFKLTVLTTLIIVFGFGVAYFVDDLRLVLAFVGSTGSTTISFILPGFFYYKLSKGRESAGGKALRYAAFALGVYGCLIFVFCLGFNIWQVAAEGGHSDLQAHSY